LRDHNELFTDFTQYQQFYENLLQNIMNLWTPNLPILTKKINQAVRFTFYLNDIIKNPGSSLPASSYVSATPNIQVSCWHRAEVSHATKSIDLLTTSPAHATSACLQAIVDN